MTFRRHAIAAVCLLICGASLWQAAPRTPALPPADDTLHATSWASESTDEQVPPLATIPIQDVRVGMRLPGDNPELRGERRQPDLIDAPGDK